VAEITKQQLDTLNDLLKRLTDNLSPEKGGGTRDPLRNTPDGGEMPNPEDAKTIREQIRSALQLKEIAEQHLRISEASAEVQNQKRQQLEDNVAILDESDKILLSILQGDEQALKAQQDKLVESKKILKVHEDLSDELDEINEKYETAASYGEELAKSAGRMLGMSEPKKGGISDVLKNLAAGGERQQQTLKGLSKGFSSMFSMSNIAVQGLQKMAEAAIFVGARFDKMSVEFGKATGTGRKYTTQMIESSVATDGLIASTGELMESAAKLQNALAGVGGISRQQTLAFREVQIATERLGVSSEDFSQIMSDQVVGMGKSTEQAQETFARLQGAADNMGMSFGDLTSQFRGSMGSFSAFGSNMEKTFLRSAGVARQLGMELGDVVAMGEKFDTFEGAANTVSDLNYIMGGQFLDTMELMSIQAEKGPAGVAEAIKEQMDATGKSFEDFTYHQKKAMADAMGMSVDKVAKFMNGTLDISKLDETEAARADMTNLLKLGNDAITIMEKLATIVTQSFDRIGKFLAPLTKTISDFIGNHKGLMEGVASGALVLGGAITAIAGGFTLLKGAMGAKKMFGGMKESIGGMISGGIKGFKEGGVKGALGGAFGGAMSGEKTGKLGTATNPMHVKVVGGSPGADTAGNLFGGKGKGKEFLTTGEKGKRFRIDKQGRIYDSTERLARIKASTKASPKPKGRLGRMFGSIRNFGGKIPGLGAVKSLGSKALGGVKSLGSKAMTGVSKMNPAKLLQSGLMKNAGKLVAKAAGPIISTVMGIASIGSILSSDMPKAEKAKALLGEAGGIIGGILGGVVGTIGGPFGSIAGALGGQYLGQLVAGNETIQGALAPHIAKLLPDDPGEKKTVTKKTAKPISPKPSAKGIASGMTNAFAALDNAQDSTTTKAVKLYSTDPKFKEMVDNKAAAGDMAAVHVQSNAKIAAGKSIIPSAPKPAPPVPVSTVSPQTQPSAMQAPTKPVEVNVGINVDDRKLREIFTTTVEKVIAPA